MWQAITTKLPSPTRRGVSILSAGSRLNNHPSPSGRRAGDEGNSTFESLHSLTRRYAAAWKISSRHFQPPASVAGVSRRERRNTAHVRYAHISPKHSSSEDEGFPPSLKWTLIRIGGVGEFPVADPGIGLSLPPEGGSRSVAGNELHVVAQRPEFLRD